MSTGHHGHHLNGFALIVVLFILLIIVGAACWSGHDGYGYGHHW
ncbi:MULTISPECIES: YjcZ family sporulation protein [Bacillaceae]|uniref:YjcZ family sporulation protein n=1 Tax=Gottfriedia acidiceleris TaxID=371036 RepID=A0ABY4JLL7_9BACI|nr:MULTISPECIES: YjcZ family sporulation protein [Bacillaceae]PEC49303.1 sporulation protein YjcZ [Bacillus sp. AFS096315]PFH89044.1 sporulation protein YjcZ [Bacillus sp. AFS088145]PFM82452.1 sporulation protein YjcZ [Bacillus sp. AFS077874]PGM52708.1 sporulation protein YjcZ [Bacillus sp. AFS053548]UPM53753.1 YjcZ family sporulation protein [Gottfriedia acidiceleris]